ncbi:PREDICTED: integrin beta-nu-like [Nicrophorus vespilloides]|uniref:Integrin beta n=1 Tax=Nicrophorus vespilloides TaxID=110193 RepID=A0ABM1N7A1_NICVS|nr:PREDICTED: integrin beta-nu-like [Nicrophorus vespilloides]
MLRSLLVLLAAIVLCGADESECRKKKEFCSKINECSTCIASDSCCIWIYDQEYTGIRCNISEEVVDTDLKYFANLKKPEIKIVLDNDFSKPEMGVDTAAVQIRPQKISVVLRKGQSVNVTLRYKAAKNYPLDLYYLMDLTFSMKDHIITLQTLGTALTEKLLQMTETYHLALGYFADKVLMPYMKMTESFLSNPCGNTPDAINQCQPGFDFVHTLNFTDDVNEFINQVKAVKYTANLDDMEGGMDAVSQVISCQREFMWRTHSRKIIVLVTDGYLHFAGDGVLGGTVKALPSGCLVHRDGNIAIYDGLHYDYPSLSYIHKLLRENKITLLMVTEKEISKYYQMMHSMMDDVTKVGELEKDSKNVLDLVEEAYTELIQNVRLGAEVDKDVASVQFYSTCNKRFGWNRTSTCNNIEIEKEYEFNVEIKLHEYKGDSAKIVIEEMNIEEKLEIEINYLGNCKCHDRKGVCKNGGIYSCGVCKCGNGWTGKNCEFKCDRNAGRWSNDTYTSTTCNRRGEFDVDTCKCVCDHAYYGEYCEWEQCDRDSRGKVCSDQGKCVESKCECDENFSGNICDCTTLLDTCIAPSGKVCDGHGDCECGNCICRLEGNITYSGKYCDRCAECSNKCDVYADDVVSIINEHPDVPLTKYLLTEVENPTETMYCLKRYIKDNKECTVKFNYEISNITEIEYAVNCLQMANVTAIAIAVSLCVIMAPLVMVLIWRFTTYVKDKKEWAQHMKQLERCEYNNMNPLYKSPITTFKNPMQNTSNTMETTH